MHGAAAARHPTLSAYSLAGDAAVLSAVRSIALKASFPAFQLSRTVAVAASVRRHNGRGKKARKHPSSVLRH